MLKSDYGTLVSFTVFTVFTVEYESYRFSFQGVFSVATPTLREHFIFTRKLVFTNATRT